MGALTAFDLEMAIAADADVVAWTREFAEAAPRVHVKFDSGMGRLGTKDVELVHELARAAADGRADDPLRHRRRARRRPLPAPAGGVRRASPRGTRSCCCTPPTARRPSAIRPRTSTWCAAASRSTAWTPSRATPPSAASSRRSSCAPGSPPCAASSRATAPATVAAGGRSEPTWVATIPIGYGDGWRRALTNDCDVLIGGRRHPLVGTVSMDNVTVDLGADTDVRVGDEVDPDRRPGRRADPRRGGRAAPGHDQLRGHLRPLAAGAPPPRAVSLVEVFAGTPAWIVGGTIRDELLGRPLEGRRRRRRRRPEAGRAAARGRGARAGVPALGGVRRLARDRPPRRSGLRPLAAPGRDDRGRPRASATSASTRWRCRSTGPCWTRSPAPAPARLGTALRRRSTRRRGRGADRRHERPDRPARRPARPRAPRAARARPARPTPPTRCARCGSCAWPPSSASAPRPRPSA